MRTKSYPMSKSLMFIFVAVASFGVGCVAHKVTANRNESNPVRIAQADLQSPKSSNMKLGAFSMSLSVKDLAVSKQFYENLGFSAMGGDMSKNYLIMKNGNALIGLFQGMFQGNILTFNPGWDENATPFDPFDDIRTIQKNIKAKGIVPSPEADETTTGPASFFLTDPDGNMILLDQHR